MRKITPAQIVIFSLIITLVLILTLVTVGVGLGCLPLGDFRGVVLTLVGVVLLYGYAILFYQGFMALFPLLPGDIPLGSRQEGIYHVHLLFFLILFYPVMRSGFIPVPLMRLFYQALGTKFGHNSFSAGILYDPRFVQLGENTLVGQGALLIPHAVEGERLAHQPIVLGNNVTIGAYAIIFGGSHIDDGAIVAAGSVVGKDSHIGHHEIWGGVPARFIRRREEKQP